VSTSPSVRFFLARRPIPLSLARAIPHPPRRRLHGLRLVQTVSVTFPSFNVNRRSQHLGQRVRYSEAPYAQQHLYQVWGLLSSVTTP
jgi:hypothetical protein